MCEKSWKCLNGKIYQSKKEMFSYRNKCFNPLSNY